MHLAVFFKFLKYKFFMRYFDAFGGSSSIEIR